jgi:type VI secretion system Hcp family effector
VPVLRAGREDRARGGLGHGHGSSSVRAPAHPQAHRQEHSPLIAKALVENQVIEGDVQVLPPEPHGRRHDRAVLHHQIKQGRVASQKQYVPDTIVPATSTEPPLEEVSFVFHTITWTFTNGGVEHEDTWNAEPLIAVRIRD